MNSKDYWERLNNAIVKKRVREKKILTLIVIIVIAFAFLLWGAKTEADAMRVLSVFMPILFIIVIIWKLYESFMESKGLSLNEVIFIEEECAEPDDEGFRFLMAEAISQIIIALTRLKSKINRNAVVVRFLKDEPGEPKIILAERYLDLTESRGKLSTQREIGILLARNNIKDASCKIVIKSGISSITLRFDRESKHVVAQVWRRNKCPLLIPLQKPSAIEEALANYL